MIDVSIIIVNYNTEILIHDAVKSVIEKSSGFSYEIIVVDNSSGGNDNKKLQEALKQFNCIKIINPYENLGFGNANNLGVQYSSGRYLHFLNSDTILVNNAIFELFDYIDKHGDVGVVGSNLFNLEQQPNHSYISVEKNIKNERKMIGIWHSICQHFTKKRPDFNYLNKPLEIQGYICGASIMISRRDYDRLGGFDKDIFMYAEESLLCYKVLHTLHKKIVNVPNSKIIHLEGGSFTENYSSHHLEMFLDGNIVYYRKVFGNRYVIKYLKAFVNSFKIKKFLSVLLISKNKKKQYHDSLIICRKKLNSELAAMRTKVVVTGVKGQLGYDCVNELKKRGYQNIIGIDKDELDITDENAVMTFFDLNEPDILIHCAAWTAVDKAEQYESDVFKVNSEGPKYLAKACKKHNAKMVFISTDYVFDGKGDTPFEIDSPKNGLSVYGKSKSAGEDNVRNNTDKYFIVRTTGVFGINGNNFIKTMLKLAQSGKKELNVVDDQIVSVTYTKDLAKLLCDMVVTDKYGVYHATNEGYVSWADFAIEIFKQRCLNVKVNRVSTAEYKAIMPGQAERPLNSRLSKKSLDDSGFKRLPLWQDSLRRFLDEIKEIE